MWNNFVWDCLTLNFCFRESNRKVEELNNKLTTTRKQLHKAMSFAEDIVREQEGLLMQLHAKQKENNLMATQFGSLKTQLKVFDLYPFDNCF